MRSIGQLARESGLTVSALRFYDSAGVFGPAQVDPQTGYRWYAPDQLADARLLCRLRRVGLPLAELRLVLAAPADADTAHRVLDAHLRRLEDGLADARRELSSARKLIDEREQPMTTTMGSATAQDAVRITVAGPELAAALAAVRFAVSTDPELPMLGGILFDLDGTVLRLVATDRYRLAVGAAAARAAAGTQLSALVPTALADEIGLLLASVADTDPGAEASVTVTGGSVSVAVGGHLVTGECLDLDFPDYRRLVRLEPSYRVELGATDLRRAVLAGPTRPARPEPGAQAGADVTAPVTVLALGGNGDLRVVESAANSPDELGAEASARAEELRVAVNQEFLLEALDATQGQLVLELGGVISPLAIRSATDVDGNFSLLMPVRLS
ncbi:DNA polymerase III subunit beta family protein [Kitasatospora kifunensis]|uniref:DNA-binding transcriptional MerR regulator n=1 Tax=Kitasatospora kifunensis TaxID=58351 RepID=A0A7W7VW11_KITKI|nr:MerR family transcriptional regulator [Kitasatospora kifunensis]MBB4924987.1 DNA-binding transcriptional MerR regulator [Kitasatospora kifunensis]